MRGFAHLTIGLLVGILITGVCSIRQVQTYANQVEDYQNEVAGFKSEMERANVVRESSSKDSESQEQEFKEMSTSMKRVMHPDPGGRTGIKDVYFDPWNTYLTQIVQAEKLLRNGEKSEAKVLAISAFSILKTFCGEAVLPPHAISREMQELLSGYFHFVPYPEDWIAITADIGC